MKLLVKTLKGGKFPIEADESATVGAVKAIIESANGDFSAAALKLIHAGKVLKDEDVLSAVGVKENDFLVAMLTKAKKVVANVVAAPKTPAPPAPKEAEAAAATTPAPAATPAPTTTTTTPAAPVQAPAATDEVVSDLVTMGFPEEAVRHCLRVAQGNPDLAVEFLTNGIPEGMEAALVSAEARGTPAAGSTTGGGPLQALRNHAQFTDLRRLVQSNPQMLQQVLTQIGQQQPDLLTEINANQALFLQMMNEPVDGGGATASVGSSRPPSAASSSSDSAPENPFGGMGNPMQMAQMIQGMNPEELTQMAGMMGVSTEQLRATAQMIGQMPPEQLNQFILQAMGGGGGGMEGVFGGGGPEGGATGGPQQVLRLTDDEMAAVDRLTEMGFDRGEAAQAFLACDKNEALAANLLMDSMMGDDSGGGSGGGNDAGPPPGGGAGGASGDDDEDMYD